MVLTRSGDLVSPPKLLPPMSALTYIRSPLPPAPSRASRSARGCDPGSFQRAASVLGHGLWDFACMLLRGESLFSAALQLSCTQALQASNQSFWGLILPVRGSRMGSLVWRPGFSLVWESLRDCDHPLVCGLPTQRCGSWLCCFCSPTHLLWLLLYTFGCGKSFMLAFRSFLLIVAL